MATKAQLLKILKETCPLPREKVRRSPATAAVALYMLQLRSHVMEATSPRFRLTISADPNCTHELHPQPVKIIHR